MDAIILLKEFEKKYPDFVNSLKNRLKSWGGNSAAYRDWETISISIS